MERECSQICTGITHYQDVVDSCIAEMRQVFCDVEIVNIFAMNRYRVEKNNSRIHSFNSCTRIFLKCLYV